MIILLIQGIVYIAGFLAVGYVAGKFMDFICDF
jgi:hypothetical protein